MMEQLDPQVPLAALAPSVPMAPQEHLGHPVEVENQAPLGLQVPQATQDLLGHRAQEVKQVLQGRQAVMVQ